MKRVIVVLLNLLLLISSSLAAGETGLILKGKVADSSGRALSGASVTVTDTYIGVYTGADGTFSIPGLKAGNYSIIISFLGYETQGQTVSLEGDKTIDIFLKEKPYLTGDVLVSAMRAGDHAPLAFSSVETNVLKRQNTGYDMPFLLGLTPSFIETSEAGNGIGYTSMRVRGTDGNRINVTIDGIPLNDAESQQVFWVDLPDLASSVDNIQVQRGAGTSSNGSGSFGATISLETLNPENDPFAELSSSVGSFNSVKNTISAGTGMMGGKFGLRMRYSEIRSDGYIDRTGSHHKSENVTGVYRSGKTLVKANIIIGEEHTGISWWGVPKEMLSVDRKYNPAGEYTDKNGVVQHYSNESDNYKQDHFQLIVNHKLNELLSFNAALHYTKGKGYYEEYGQAQNYADYGLENVVIGDSVLTRTDLIRRKWMSNDFYGMVYSLKYKTHRLEAILGGGMNRYLGANFGRLIWMQYAGTTSLDHQWYLNNSDKGEISIYGKATYSLSDRLSAFGDLQFRHIGYSLKGIDDDQKDLGQDHRFGFFNPKAGLFWNINSYQDAWFSLSVAHREPTREDFKEATGDKSATPRPEVLYDAELGYKIRTGKASLGVNLYGMIYKDQLVPTGQLSDVGYSIMTNVTKSYRAGVEFIAGLKPTSFCDWNVNLTLSKSKILDFVEYYTNYNTTDGTSKYLSGSLGTVDIAYSPSIIGTSDMLFRLGRSAEFHFISKYVGKQYVDNTMSTERMVDPYFVSNVRFDYTPLMKKLKGLQIQLLVNNIFNSMYVSNGYGGNWYEDGIEKSWSYYFPQAGINYMVRFDLKF